MTTYSGCRPDLPQLISASGRYAGQNIADRVADGAYLEQNFVSYPASPDATDRSLGIKPGNTLIKRSRSLRVGATLTRKQYGNLETMVETKPDGTRTYGKFRVESGDEGAPLHEGGHSWILTYLENPESQTRWYFKFFLGREHQNFMGVDSDKNIFVLSMVIDDSGIAPQPICRCVLWRKTGSLRLSLPCTSGKPVTARQALHSFSLTKFDRLPKEITTPSVQKDLMVLESQEGSMNFKFGLLYAKANQTTDDEFFSNEHGSPEFERFMLLLGEKITLQGWENYRGGLDVRTGTTGTQSIYTRFEGHEIMFHVSTLLPFSRENRQQLERKRHLGNDIVVIVFADGNELPNFQPHMIKSHFNHVFALVCYNKPENVYKLRIFSEEGVALYGPPLPYPCKFSNFESFRDFLMVKLMNGEKAAYSSTVFAAKRQRTLDALLKGFEEQYRNDASKAKVLYDRLPDVRMHMTMRMQEKSPQTRRRKSGLLKAQEFVRYGQDLKLGEIMKGDAPTSQLSSATVGKSTAWEPIPFFSFPHEIELADSWGDSGLLVITPQGCFVIEENNFWQVVEPQVAVRQIHVAAEHNVLLFTSHKERFVHAYRLDEVTRPGCSPISRLDTKFHRIDSTKGCHLFAVSRPENVMMRVAVAVRSQIRMYIWKHSSIGESFPKDNTALVNSFLEMEHINLHETPQQLLLVDHARVERFQHNKLCVFYRQQYDLIDEHTHNVERLHDLPCKTPCSVADQYEEGKAELLISYNNTSVYLDVSNAQSPDRPRQMSIHWTCVPQAIVCKFPFVMAFSDNMLEVRLCINGTLVHSCHLPDLRHLASRYDVYFTSTEAPAEEVASVKGRDKVTYIYMLAGVAEHVRAPLASSADQSARLFAKEVGRSSYRAGRTSHSSDDVLQNLPLSLSTGSALDDPLDSALKAETLLSSSSPLGTPFLKDPS